ncbi:OmpA family protein [Flavobacterium branchiophilum]|uniref:OmpA family protein n=2 Tax=Flavobacterium branchiophilum TaxID=55197 RepID=A0A2H3KJ36_9FLAO|nr:OmpA family protein [Flavobacterium branchiophilum]PDS24720.1 OmpA family protein [Flavobacterium branchiophilum]CCB68396.1 Probable outer membrane protein precursor, OmpA family [Flavobacterium branchiophilum FL-15]
MKIKIALLFFWQIFLLQAQEEAVQSVYFQFDKFNLDDKQAADVVNFIIKSDTSRIASVQIFGYCDDRGQDAYNFKLSNNRANTIKNKLIDNGIKNKIIVTIEGKGRVLIDDDIVENLPEIRSKNRRVDVVLNLKPLPKLNIPGLYNTIKKTHTVGDRIYLEKVYFEKGSSQLTSESVKELYQIARQLHKFKNFDFEIQGHVCCTPPYQKEAIDKDTKKRGLSKNRAEAVYNYFISKNINKDRMTFKGYGNTRPLNKGSEYDRRVELVITKTY